jgi:sialate O-acetylesterase
LGDSQAERKDEMNCTKTFWASLSLVVTHFLLLVSPVAAEVVLPSIFSDHMILQSDAPVSMWGWAQPNETVTVSIAGQIKATRADDQGNWRLNLDALKVGVKTTMTVKGSNVVTINDVLIGDVWLFAGDAFMNKRVDSMRLKRKELTNTKTPAIRLFRMKTTSATEPQRDVEGSWVVLDEKNAGDFPAVSYFFARESQARASIPFGIIEATDPTTVSLESGGKVIGSTVEAWMSEKTLQVLPAAKPILEYYESPLELQEALRDYEKKLGDWKLSAGKAFGDELRELEQREPDVWFDYIEDLRKAGKPVPDDPPRRPTAETLRRATTRASNLHNSMIAPIRGFALRGVAMSIGMANAPRAVQYRELFPALIQDWRTAWDRKDLPFVFLQQSRAHHPNMDPRAFAELREAQAIAARLPHTAMVRTIDLGGKIFPDDVQTLAKRMVDSAIVVTGVGTAVNPGPVIEKVTFEDGKAIVEFSAETVGLSVRGGGDVLGFALTERPNRWAYAEAKITGDRVIVSHTKLKAPIALRYDWVTETGFEGNLTDASGLPVLPYRTDDWPAFTDTPAAKKPNALATIVPPDLYPVVDPSLPRVLLIGDSIKNGYTPYVKSRLDGKVNVAHLTAFGMIGKKDPDAEAFCAKLKDGDYALIHYNDGLHSLPPRITDEQFGVGLTAMLKHLKTVTPRVVWATTTPHPDHENTLSSSSQNLTIAIRNRMSKEIAARFDVPVIDLYELVLGDREKLQKFANVHFNPEGSKLMGDHIASRILAALDTK